MKKLWKAFAVCCAIAMLGSAFTACKSDDDDDDDKAPVTISISSENYKEGSFIVGDTATLTAKVENSTKNVTWSVNPEGIVSLSSGSVGSSVTITAESKGSAVITAKCDGASDTFEVSVGVNPATAELTKLPWSVSMGAGFGTNDVFTKNVDDAGHGTWCTNNSEVSYDGIYYYGAANGYQYYAEEEGVWFNWYSSANTEIGNSTEGTRLESYMAIAEKSLNSEKNIKITVKAKAILKAETEGQEVKQPRLAVYDSNKYVISDTELTEEAADYTFIVSSKQKILIGNNGPNGSYMVVYSVSAEEVEEEALSQQPSVNSVTVTVPAQVQLNGNTQVTATVSVKFNADKTVKWSTSNAEIATVSDTGVVTGVGVGTVKVIATSVVDETKTGEAEIEVISGEVKPIEGTTYTWDIKDYATTTSQGDPIADGTSNDTFLSWTGVKYHSDGYGVTCTGTYSIKVAGNVVVSIVGSIHSGGTFSVATEDGTEVLGTNSTKTAVDKTPFSFIYKGEATTLVITFSGTNYLGTITVKPLADEVAAVTEIKLADTTVLKDKTVALKADITSNYFADPSVTWSSDTPGVASIDEKSGVVSGVSVGTAIITATSVNNPEVSGSCTVTVEEGVIKTNTFDFSTGVTDIKATEDASVGIVLSGASYHGSTYGARGVTTATIDVNGPALITLYPTYQWSAGSMKLYASGDTSTVLAEETVSTGGNDAKIENAGDDSVKDPLKYATSVVYTGDAGKLDLVIDNSGNTYFWKIVVVKF